MTQLSAASSLRVFPDEILQSILQYLDAKSLVSVGAVSRRLLALSREELFWKRLCQSDFRYWNNRRESRQLPPDVSINTWKDAYQHRYGISRSTNHILDEIITDSKGRSDRIQAIVDLGYKTKDALLQAFRDSPSSPNHLAQKYWSHIALGCLHRTIALEEWNRIKFRNDVADPTERALAAFDMFILDQQEHGDIDDIFDRLNSYVEAIRAAYPDIEEQTPRTRAMTVASYVRERHWVGIDQGREYHTLDNMFLGVALFSSHNNSLPLISAVIYSYVARQFDLRADPVGYPMHVHVLVQPPPGFDLEGNRLPLTFNTEARSAKTHMYMDPFNSIEPVPMSTLETHLRFIVPAGTPAQIDSFLSPATTRDLIIRTAHNVLNTRTMDQRSLVHPVSAESAIYAGFFAHVMFPTHPAALRTHITELTQHFLHHYDHDIHIFRNYILPLTSNLPDHLAYLNLSHHFSTVEAPVPKFRTAQPAIPPPPPPEPLPPSFLPFSSTRTTPPHEPPTASSVRYKIGSLFRHRRRSYLALIYGWDPTCVMTPQWITMNQVDRLPRGRHQPFYNVLVIDDRSTRYVAEENVVLLGPEEEGGNGEWVTVAEVEEWPIEVGKWMKRFVADEEGRGCRFVSNVRDEYPED